MADLTADEYRCGFVAIAGRPNVGKSTLVNAIVEQPLCIVTPKAQTTRNRITAIHSGPNAQMILLDTPGIHEADTPLNKAMVDAATRTLESADVILFMTVPSHQIPHEDRVIAELIQEASTPCVLAINKIDTVEPPALLPVIAQYAEIHDFKAIIPISALERSGLDDLTSTLRALLPESPPLFPEDEVSDMPVRFFVAEIIREQVLNMTSQEVPYKTSVVVEHFKERESGVLIQADIHVERQSQKKILVGKGGSKIKAVGIAAREKIEEFLGTRVRLELFVKVSPHWTRKEAMLREFGYLT